MVENMDLNDQFRETLTNLKFAEDKLEEEIGNLHHELRRVRDGIERVGNSSHELDRKKKQLLSNIELCERELKENRKQQERMSEHLNPLNISPDCK